MDYLKTPVSNGPSTAAIDKAINTVLDKVSTPRLLWHITKRHKFGLVATWALIVTACYLFPPLPDMLFALIGR